MSSRTSRQDYRTSIINLRNYSSDLHSKLAKFYLTRSSNDSIENNKLFNYVNNIKKLIAENIENIIKTPKDEFGAKTIMGTPVYSGLGDYGYRDCLIIIQNHKIILRYLNAILAVIPDIQKITKNINDPEAESLREIEFESLLKSLESLLELNAKHNHNHNHTKGILMPNEILTDFLSKLLFHVKHYSRLFEISLDNKKNTDELIDEINWRVSMKLGKNKNDIEVIKSKTKDENYLVSINVNKIDNPLLIEEVRDCIKISFDQLGLKGLNIKQFHESKEFFEIRELFELNKNFVNNAEKPVDIFDKVILDNGDYIRKLFEQTNENLHPTSDYIKLFNIFAKDTDSFKKIKDALQNENSENNIVVKLILSSDNLDDCKEKIGNLKKELSVSSVFEGHKKIPEEGQLLKKITSFAHGYSIDNSLNKDLSHLIELNLKGKINSLSTTECKKLISLFNDYNNDKLSKKDEKELLEFVSFSPSDLTNINNELFEKYSTIRDNDKYQNYVSSKLSKATDEIHYLPKKFDDLIIEYLDNIIKESSKKDNKPDTNSSL